MSFGAGDLGVLANLATAMGLLDADGDPEPGWFGAPDQALKTMLADDGQRAALIAFVDEALGGADRDTDAEGVVWLPVVGLDHPKVTLAVTIDDRPADAVHVGLGVKVDTGPAGPVSTTSISVPLFRAAKVGHSVSSPFLLGQPGGRLRLASTITVDASAPVPGVARVGTIGIDVEVPTAVGDGDPSFGLVVTGLQLPGATSPRDLHLSAAGADQLDDALLQLVMEVVRQQATALGGPALGAVAGLLGLGSDAVPTFPLDRLAAEGIGAVTSWITEVASATAARHAWIDHLAALVGGARVGEEVVIALGVPGSLRLGVRLDTGAGGSPRLTATLGLDLGTAATRVEARAELCAVDLVTGAAAALPSFGVWAATGTAASPVLNVPGPEPVRADTLRVGFALDAARKLTFVLAADQVHIGAHGYPTLDLTSADAVMDAAGNAVEDVANQLLAGLGGALATARVLLGLDPPPGHAVPTISLGALLSDPLGAVTGYWHTLVTAHAAAVPALLGEVRDALRGTLADPTIRGTGAPGDPWTVPLVNGVALEITADGNALSVAVAAGTSVDQLGQRCTVVEGRLAATVATVDLAARTASLLPGVAARLLFRERGANPPRAVLRLGEGVELAATHVGLGLGWTAAGGLRAAVEAPALSLRVEGDVIPVPVPVIGPDGSATLPPEAWDAVEAVVGTLAGLVPGLLGDVARVLGWSDGGTGTGLRSSSRPGLRLADLVTDPAAALAAWLPEMALSELGPHALGVLADLVSRAGPVSGALAGTGHPDDPYRIPLAASVPEPAVWFPPAGLEPRVAAAPEGVRRWRPGDPGLDPASLDQALRAEGAVAADVGALVKGRDIAGGLAALATRWAGTDGRIAPPATAPAGIGVARAAVAAGQLLGRLDLEDELGRVPTTVVFVDLGAAAWPDAPAGRRVDLTAAGLAPEMITPPAPAAGEWFVALGERAACRLATGDDDGTAGQAARLGRVLTTLAPLGNDLVVVALVGAGHAARVAADAQPAVSDLVLLGTPLGPVSLTVLGSQPGADALRLLHRLVPPAPGEGDGEAEDADLALGRHLVASLMELTTRADPTADLRPAATPAPGPRAGLTVSAWFGSVDADRVGRAITAVVVAGLAARARERAAAPLPEPTGVHAGLRLAVPSSSTGTLRVEGDALVTLVGYDRPGGLSNARSLRVRLSVSDRLGWLIAGADQELRMVTIDATIPLGGTAGAGAGAATVTLHDARVFGQSWERLVVGTGDGQVPLLAEARVLLATAVQRLVVDAGGSPPAAAAVALGEALGLIVGGGAVNDAFDHLVHDPAGLVATAMAGARPRLAAAIGALLGPVAATLDLAARSVTLAAGDDTTGPFGWHAAVGASLTAGGGPSGVGVAGTVTFGPGAPGPAGGLQLAVTLAPLAAELRWHHPGSATEVIDVWPEPDGAAIAAAVARAAPGLGAHVALEIMRRADDTVRPVVDAALDALGLLAGAAGDAERAVRPLAGLLSDPAGWLRSSAAIGGQPARAQALFDALRPLLGAGGAAGTALALRPGITVGVAAEGAGLRLEVGVDSRAFGAPPAAGRLAAGLSAGLVIGASGPPIPALDVHVGLESAAPGRQAVHAGLGPSGATVFLRPGTGADIPLLPFAGLGGLATAAKRALPFLLDTLAGRPAPVGPAVAGVGDALGLRSGSPRAFDADSLTAWATDPAAALVTAVPSIVATGLASLAPVLDGLVPAAVSITAAGNDVTATAGPVSVVWTPTAHRVAVRGTGIAVAGIEHLSFTVALSNDGVDEVSATLGPADLDLGSAHLRPWAHVAAGQSPPGGAGIAVGLALDATRRFGARWLFDPTAFDVVVGDGPLAGLDAGADPAAAAARAVEVLIDLVAGVAIGQPAVQTLLDTTVGATNVRGLLRAVVLEDTAAPAALLPGVFDPSTLLVRVQRLFVNLAGAGLTVSPAAGVTVGLLDLGGHIGVRLDVAQRMELITGDVMLWLESDATWIEGNPPKGLFVGILRSGGPLSFEPSLVVNGVGLRIGKQSGPLLDLGVTLESIAVHAFAQLDLAGARSGGAQLQLTNLAVSASGASGGNAIAQGIVRDTGPQPPKPAFSPALAIQKHGTGDVHVSLRAGDGDGPWWIAIQKGFGPLYLEQIGFGVTMPNHKVDRVSLLLDGSVSMFGLTCAVDDLQITYLVSRNDFFNPASWDIDLAGLAVSADMAGLAISGGLLKSVAPNGDIEYLGMLLARFGVYGITIYGGYGQGDDNGTRFVAFFAVGAIVGPIGGPPAFFLTGIGGGFGINRQLVVPTDLSRFGEYPLIQALDTAASPGNPMEQLRALGQYFPMKRGTFWFAAGLSFTSFVIVDGIAVVAVEVGDGLDITLLGLARMALPRPQVALVSIELALLVRFSSSEGVLWVQGQLTDNSYLLYRDVKLTGGFAYVIWFKGPNRGQFVLTMGGFHPDFHRDGYPVVPRLGLRWSVGSAIVIKAGSYFALTSEAVMAGGDFEASAHFGPAWAEVRFGAHGIVYFDPFHYKVNAYARIAAGVTIDTWLFGEITISISIGATIEVEGPDFHGRATFDVGPIGLSVEFGSRDKHVDPPLPAATFIAKYLDVAPGGDAQAITLITSFGTQPPGSGAPTPDGRPDRPFVVVAEFGLVLTTVVPASLVRLTGPGTAVETSHPPSRSLGVAPMDRGAMQPRIELSWVRDGIGLAFPFVAAPRPFGAFPVGVWGPPQDDDHRPMPKGDVIEALCELDLSATATESPGGPQIPYFQVEIGKRKPLPFSRRTVDATSVRNAGGALAALVTEPATADAAFAEARRFLAATASPTALAALAGERQAPPLLGTLGEGLDTTTANVVPPVGATPVKPDVDRSVHAAQAYAFLPAWGAAAIGDPSRAGARGRTTVKDTARLWQAAPPTLASVEAVRSRSIAAGLVVVEPPATVAKTGTSRRGTLIATGDVPPSEAARGRPALVRSFAGDAEGHLRAFSAALRGGGLRADGHDAGHPGAVVGPGDVAVLRMPNARRDVDPEAGRPRLGVKGPAVRVVALADGAVVVDDRVVDDAWPVVASTERIVVVGLGRADDARPVSGSGLVGWHAGMQLPYVGWSTAVGPGCTVRTRGEGISRHPERSGAGWVSGAELARGVSTVATRFADPVTTVVIVLDDPSAFGADAAGRELLLGLAGAVRVVDGSGGPKPPVVLVAENRSVLAYDVVAPAEPQGPGPENAVTVTVASEDGWSVAGVLGAAGLDAEAAIALITARGLDAAIAPLAAGSTGTTTLRWLGPRRPPARPRRSAGPAPKPAPGKAAATKAKPAKKAAAKATKNAAPATAAAAAQQVPAKAGPARRAVPAKAAPSAKKAATKAAARKRGR